LTSIFNFEVTHSHILFFTIPPQDFARAEALADKQLAAHGGRCEHALYIKALIRRNTGEMEESYEHGPCPIHFTPLVLRTPPITAITVRAFQS
jgi:hypothetical protein